MYWKAGLAAIPLRENEKRPAISEWQVYAERLPTNEEQQSWLKAYQGGNIGLALGPASGVVAIDIDTDDPVARQAIDRVLPPSPFERIGAKGAVRMYRYSGERTARIQSDNGMVCEILSGGSQVVMPGSIHPDTLRPYRANTNLWEVLDQLPKLPSDIERRLRSELKAAGFNVSDKQALKTIDFVPAGARNNSMVKLAGLLARAVSRNERTLLEALGEMEAWVLGYVEQVPGDPLTVEEAQKKVIHFLARDAEKRSLPSGWDTGLTDEDIEKLGLVQARQNRKMTQAEILDYLAHEICISDGIGLKDMPDVIDKLMVDLARSVPEIDSIGQDRIMSLIVSQSGGAIRLTTLRKKLKELLRGDIEGENHNEIAKAALNSLSEYGEVRHCGGSFLQWEGSHWTKMPDGEIVKFVAEEFGNLPASRKTSDYKQIESLMAKIAAAPLASSHVRGVNFANGFLDEDLVLHPHSPEFGATTVLPYRYLPEHVPQPEMFLKFLEDSWGEDLDFKDKVKALQEAVGATLFGAATEYQKVFCLYGKAHSGKSVAAQIVMSLLPDEAISTVAPEKWHDKFLPAQLFGKAMNFAGELPESRKISGDIFKQVVAGERISAQHKNKDPFSFNPQAAHWFNSNHLPKSDDTSQGFTRRWLFLEWNKAVSAERADVNLARRIIDEEREAIANWAIEGYARLKEQGRYTEPESHKVLARRMASENNSVLHFLNSSDNIRVGLSKTTNEVKLYALHDAYISFCWTTGVRHKVEIHKFEGLLIELQEVFGFEVQNRTAVGGQRDVVVRGIERDPKLGGMLRAV